MRRKPGGRGKGSSGRSGSQGEPKEERRTFYTSLYRTRLAPILFQDVDGRYRGADGNVHTAEGYRKHAIFSLWDTFRGAHPLFTLIDPDRVDDLINSMLSFHDEHGLLPVWSLVGNETNTMTGHHAVPVIADAYRKGYRGFDAQKALAAMVKSAQADHRGLEFYKSYGYIPTELETESVTKTLEYVFDDWAIAMCSRCGGGECRSGQRGRNGSEDPDPGANRIPAGMSRTFSDRGHRFAEPPGF